MKYNIHGGSGQAELKRSIVCFQDPKGARFSCFPNPRNTYVVNRYFLYLPDVLASIHAGTGWSIVSLGQGHFTDHRILPVIFLPRLPLSEDKPTQHHCSAPKTHQSSKCRTPGGGQYHRLCPPLLWAPSGLPAIPSIGLIETISSIGSFIFFTRWRHGLTLTRGFVLAFGLISHLISFIPIFERDIPLKDESISHKHTHDQ